MKYKVFITESHTYSMDVEADSKEQAQEIAGHLAAKEGREVGGLYETESRAYTEEEVASWRV